MVSRDEKRWRFFAHVVLIILSFMAVMPFYPACDRLLYR